MMRIAFYAPLKPPGHPVPSGDRTMARLLIKALKAAGHEVETASQYRSFSKMADFSTISDAAGKQVDKIINRWRNRPADLWFSYHPYYKAPDLIGARVARHFGLPVITAEASLSQRRQHGPWQEHQQSVLQLVNMAQANFWFTRRDRNGLAKHAGCSSRLVFLPPFTDAANGTEISMHGQAGHPVRLACLAMMRNDVKLESYAFLARALEQISGTDWQLTIIGDGPARAQVTALFARFSKDQVLFRGEIAPGKVAGELVSHDIFVWPGIGEAYGLCYLEAQACGLPVVALKTHGVPSAVAGGRTGLLTMPGDTHAYGAAIARLITDAHLRRQMAQQAVQFVQSERNLDSAVKIISKVVNQCV